MPLQKTLSICLLLLATQGIFSQVLLSSHPLELKKADNYHQALLAPDARFKQLVVCASDKNNLYFLHYNNVIYYTDSLMANRPDKEYTYMAGYSFDDYKSGTVYWASNNLEKLEAVHYNFDNAEIKEYLFDQLFGKEEILSSFSANNNFYVITQPEEDKSKKLKCYTFNNNRYESHTIDFSGITFKDEKNKPISLEDLLYSYPLAKIDNAIYNPLTDAVSKSKLYTEKDIWVLALDHNPLYTQLLFINPDNFTVTEKVIAQPILKEEAGTNSYYLGNKLYQVALNKEEVALQAVDINTKQVLNAYHAGAEDEITFKNSELLQQNPNGRPLEFKDTKRFLRKARNGDAAISVYRTPDDILVTAGSVRSYIPAGDVVLGAGLLMGGIAPGDGFYAGEQETMYFDGLFGADDFKHKPYRPERLAADHISKFMYRRNDITLPTVSPFDYYYILGYYDVVAKQYIIRKFYDDLAY
ncbi:hypothetical protein [Flavobacterium rhizosphaerae]|uniref:DKNYY family protein n=1 Tax=Flavobacterium rhizosphaerae TaxID=3163298 RepID=A0ABW8YVQ3_9FLAO